LDNLNTPKLLSSINKNLNESHTEYLDDLLYSIFYIDEKFLKLDLLKSVQEEINKKTVEAPEEIQRLAQKRLEAKKDKNWTEADKLRQEILEK